MTTEAYGAVMHSHGNSIIGRTDGDRRRFVLNSDEWYERWKSSGAAMSLKEFIRLDRVEIDADMDREAEKAKPPAAIL